MSKTLNYIFDPLCGWCYGAAAALSAVAKGGVELRLLPSGMFSEAGARPMDDAFAAYAWSNDQRIERLTGQRFSERYRSGVLADRGQAFDSGPATLALTAVALTSPEYELEALEAIQKARYVEGLNITRANTLAEVLGGLGLSRAAERLIQSDEEVLEASRARMGEARSMLQQVGGRGVPTFVLEQGGQNQLLQSSALYSNPQAFAELVAAE